jgi:hypothetical protein
MMLINPTRTNPTVGLISTPADGDLSQLMSKVSAAFSKATQTRRSSPSVAHPMRSTDAPHKQGLMVVDHGGMCPLWVNVARQLVDGLIYMHHMGVSHNDLKPANVFYTMKVSTAPLQLPL